MSVVHTMADNLSSLLHLLLTPLTYTISLLPPRALLQLTLFKDVFAATVIIIFGRLFPPLPTLTSTRTNTPPPNLTGKTAIVTGSNSGLGLQIAQDLAQLGATVILACRTPSKADAAVSTIHNRVPESRGRVSAMRLDTSSLESVRSFATVWLARPDAQKQVDVLVHNAGIGTPPVSGQDLTDAGLDIIYATNLLGSFLLTHLLEPCLSPTARVVFTSSTGQYSGRFKRDFATGPVRGVSEAGFHCPVSYSWIGGWEKASMDSASRYGNTKSMQCALARLLQRRWDLDVAVEKKNSQTGSGNDATESQRGRGRVAHSFTPGFAATPIFGKTILKNVWTDLPFALLKATQVIAVDVAQGARTGSWLASTQDERVVGPGNGGGYWDRMTRRVCGADLFGDELLERLWTRWENDAGVTWK